MLRPIIGFLLFGLGLGCGSRAESDPNMAMRFTTTAGALYHCMDAKVTRLGADGEGGYRFVCPSDGDATMELVQRQGPSGAELVAITLSQGLSARPTDRVLLSATHAELEALGLPACGEDSVDKGRVQRGLARKDGQLAYGSFRVLLAYPCGEGILQIGKPLNQP